MADITDDTESFNIALESAPEPITCNYTTPHFSSGCALLLHIDNLIDGDGVIRFAEFQRSILEFLQGNITHEEAVFVMGPYTDTEWDANHNLQYNINDLCAGCYAPPAVAKGEIVNLDYPSSVKHGASFDVNASTKNVGSAASSFRMELWVDGVRGAQSPSFVLAAGATSSDMISATNAPASGTSMSCVVKCIRIA